MYHEQTNNMEVFPHDIVNFPRQAQGAVDNGGRDIMREQGRWQQ